VKSRASPESGRWFAWPLLLGDFSVASWLWFSFWKFNGQDEPTLARVLAPSAVSALLALLLGTHRAGRRPWLTLPARLAGLALAVAALSHEAAAMKWLPVTAREALWLGAALVGMLGILRSFYWRQRGPEAQRACEVLRWAAVGLAATLAMLPFYFGGSVGSGDAHWYTVMLSDFLAQLKAGAFPVWVGQSPFAFNGAVSPIRYAPGFQYYGGMVDLLTAQALQPVSVKNLCLCLSAVGGAFSAYACLRPIVNERRWIACLLAILWIIGPGVLAPVISGDQYMTFVALPFVPIVLHGCWRLLVFDDLWGRLWISVGLAGLWICHPPIGLWMTLIAGALYLSSMLSRRRWIRELRCLPVMAAIFLAMASYPFISLLNLDNQTRIPSLGGSAAFEVHKYFPGNFMPINPALGSLFDYQIGYALLGTLAVSLLLLAVTRPRAAVGFALASILVVPFTVPVPLVTDAVWARIPSWFVTINNVWPMQRLFLIWSALAAFTGAIVIGSPRVSGTFWRQALAVSILAAGLLWSATEAHKLETRVARTRSSPEQARIMEGPNNTVLGRYAFGSFQTTPGYASHGYMDSWFENRLLDSKSREPFLTNGDAAAPGDGQGTGNSTLVSKGLLRAENITDSTSYFLRPNLTLDPGKRYALRLEFFDPETQGVLQLMQDTMFREYLLPDSGAGIGRSGPPRSFGTEATSGRVLSLSVLGKKPVPLTDILITPRPNHKDFTAGRFWLYTYERNRLPITVESWIPYRVRFTAPRAAFLESPRMWLKDWRATVNGIPVLAEPSPEGLVMVPVKAGPNTVTLDYIPPVFVRAAFWVLFCSWLLAGIAALAWLLGAPLPRVPQAIACFAPLWRHRLLLLGAVAATAAILYGERRSAKKLSYSSTAGPIEVRFLLPYGKSGASEPIVATGHPQAGVIVFVMMLDRQHVAIGADVWGTLYKSGPLETDYSQMHTLVVSDSALYPQKNPAVMSLPPQEVDRLRHELRVELDGSVAIEASCYAYEAGPSEIYVGSAPFGSTAAAKFTGEFIDSRRLPIPRLVGMPWGDRAHLDLRFPTDRAGETESLLTFKSEQAIQSYSATYVSPRRLRITASGPDGAARQAAEFDADMAAEHTMSFIPSEPADGKGSFDLSCEFDGQHILGGTKPRVLAVYPQLSSGVNLFAAHSAQNRFSGPELNLAFTSDGTPSGPAEQFGPVHMIVMLPNQRTGRHEPILATGRTGAGDLIYILYEDRQHIRIGFDHWGVGGKLSEPIEVDYSDPHEFWILEGALFPDIGNNELWAGTPAAMRSRLKSLVAVVVDGKTVISEASATYPSTIEQVTMAKNGIGASTADAEFSGILRYAERTGTFLPPGLVP
jgi:hypothetical protein